MPLDAPQYLASQGWGGRGQPLKPNSNGIAKPVILAQKKTLGGLGKDRDEAFAFWDHIYAASASSINIKIHNDSDTEASSSTPPPVVFQRTSTGLISNRQPSIGVSASPPDSGTSTPTGEAAPRLSLLALAKREAAKRGLYQRFYRGPVVGEQLGPESDQVQEQAEPMSISPIEEAEVENHPALDIAVDELALKAQRKASKAARKAERAEKRAKKEEKQRKKEELKLLQEEAAGPVAGASVPMNHAPSKSKKRKHDEVDDDMITTDTRGDVISTGSKKKRRRVKNVTLLLKTPPPDTDAASAEQRQSPSESPAFTRKAILKIRRRSKSREEGKEKGGMEGKRVTFSETVLQRVVPRWLKQVPPSPF